ncbi:hypothetical protein BAUCODRAFT_118181 [Baudoinia panamericana UAMH 10762]|uniref:Major facilitator superfamily (MFS) profile domain-containing protein n=1 Tax=Baudoinia panamericana (strain UAMH 10762) TaxID=717646 RepID=M2M088_BAUPA|nr:uncharacterized protein BAUCODRAFT_118181 [Baudoinia panamericana UAMH 10762]EMD00408.1 hypothetical protein BAUCODRAFT_118181 [Baudoinia panamericana UAMH 10762]
MKQPLVPSSEASPSNPARVGEASSHTDPESGGVGGKAPEGGFQAWLQCANTFCLWFAARGLVNSFGIYQAYYEDHALRNKPPSDISWIGSLQVCIFIGGTTVVGPIFDIGHLTPLLAVGTILTVLGLVFTSLCSTFGEFLLAQGLCTGLGMTCLFVPCVAVLPSYFASNRALAMGIASSGSSVGAVVFTLIFERLWPRIGFGWTTRVIAFIILGSLLLPLLTMRKWVARSPRRALINTPALREPAFDLMLCTMLFMFMGMYVPYFYIEVFSTKAGVINSSLEKYLVTSMNVGSFAGRLLPGTVADRVGVLNTIGPCALLTAIVAFSWIAVTTRASILAFTIFYGFFSGWFQALVPVLWAVLCPDPARLGTRIGMATVPYAIGDLLGGPIGGALIHGSSFVGLQVFCGGTLLTAAGFLLAARMCVAGFRITIKA